MKICRFLYNEKEFQGILSDDKIYPLTDGVVAEQGFEVPDVIFLPPTAPSKIVCVGRNYAAHAAELGNEIPSEPLLFLKAPSAIVIDGQPIEIPNQSVQVEHEGELAVVIGRECSNLVESDDPFRYVFGYVCLNDVTARDLQRRDVQFTRAKSFDTFCPISKFIETDLDVADLSITTKVNGEIKQNGRTSQMVFPVDFLIRYVSRQMTLKIGDVIATGTPAGVSKLKSGDVCEIEIQGIGTLSNPVI